MIRYNTYNQVFGGGARIGESLFNLDLSVAPPINVSQSFASHIKSSAVGEYDCIKLTNPNSNSFVIGPYPQLKMIDGAYVSIRCYIKAENISGNPRVYLRVYDTTTSANIYPSTIVTTSGTYDWTLAEGVFEMPKNIDCTNAVISFQAVNATGTGTCYFRGISISQIEKSQTRTPYTISATRTEPMVRGFMTPTNAKQIDIMDMKNVYGANFMRYQINGAAADGVVLSATNLVSYRTWLEKKLKILDDCLLWAKQNEIKILIDMHHPFGASVPGIINPAGVINQYYYDNMLIIWKEIVNRYKNHPSVWGYEIINEPFQFTLSANGPLDRTYWSLQKEFILATTEIDATKKIIVDVNGYTNPNMFRYVEPMLTMTNIWYTSHMYLPAQYTTATNTTGTYPGMQINGKTLNKEYLVNLLQPVRDFQLTYNVPIYIGEFSTPRWTSGANLWLRDCIEIFEEYDWDWSYHAFREADMWDIEYQNLPQNPATKSISATDRAQVLTSAFQKNVSLWTSVEQTPIPPTLSATQTKYTEIKLDWNWPNCSVSAFVPEYKTSASGTWVSATSLSAGITNSLSISGLGLLSGYDFRINLKNRVGQTYSQIVTKYLDILYPTSGTSAMSSRIYSLRKCLSSYNGSSIRVRRSSDNAEQDIGFTTSGDLNTTALTSFVTSGSGYIVTFYDQTGTANLGQSATSQQPMIVSAGAVLTDPANGKPFIRFNGTSTNLRNWNPFIYEQGQHSIFCVNRAFVASAAGPFLFSETPNLSVSGQMAYLKVWATSANRSSYRDVTGYFFLSETGTTPVAYDGNLNVVINIDTGTSAIDMTNNLTPYYRSYTRTGYTKYTQIFAIGARVRNFNDNFFTGAVQELIVTDKAIDLTTASSIYTNQKNYWKTH